MTESYDEMQILAYVEGEMPAEEAHQFKLMLLTDARLRRLVEQLAADRDALRALPREHAPADLMERVNDHLERDMLLHPGTGAGAGAGKEALPRAAAERRLRLVRFAAFTGLAAMLVLGGGLIYSTIKQMAHGEGDGAGPVAMDKTPRHPEIAEPADAPAPIESDSRRLRQEFSAAASGELKSELQHSPMAAGKEKADADEAHEAPAAAMMRRSVSADDMAKRAGTRAAGAGEITLDATVADAMSGGLSADATPAAPPMASAPLPPTVTAVPATPMAAADVGTLSLFSDNDPAHLGATGSPSPTGSATVMSAPAASLGITAGVAESSAPTPAAENAAAKAERREPVNLSLAVITEQEEAALVHLIVWARQRDVTVTFAGTRKSVDPQPEAPPGAELLSRVGRERVRLTIRIKAKDLSGLVSHFNLRKGESAFLIRDPQRAVSSVLTPDEQARRDQKVARQAGKPARTPDGWADLGDLVAQEVTVDPATLNLDPDEDLTLGLIVRSPAGVHRDTTDKPAPAKE